MFITDDEVQKCIDYLGESAKEYATTKARMKHLEQHRKSVRAAQVLKATGKTISENTNRAEASEAYVNIVNEYKESVAEFTLIEAYRKTAELKIEVWRSLNASHRRGNI